MVRYSTELRKMVYFEAYGEVVQYRHRKYYRYDGISLSSFRPINVLVPVGVGEKLMSRRVRKFVVFRTTSNESLVLNMGDSIVNIYDKRTLKRLTGKEGSIPERVYERIKRIEKLDSNMAIVNWCEIPTLAKDVLTILALYNNRSGLGMKLIRVEGSEKVKNVVSSIPYTDGILIQHKFSDVFLPYSIHQVSYKDIIKVIIIAKGWQEADKEIFEDQEDLLEEEGFEEGRVALW